MRAPTLREFFAFLVALLGAAGVVMVLMMLCLASAAKAEPMILAYQNTQVGVAVLMNGTSRVGDTVWLETLTVFRRPIDGADYVIRRDQIHCSDFTIASGSYVAANLSGKIVRKGIADTAFVPLKRQGRNSELWMAAKGECLGMRPIESMDVMGFAQAVEAFRKEAP